MNNDIIIKILKNRSFGTYTDQYEILTSVLSNIDGLQVIMIYYNYRGVTLHKTVRYDDYLDEVKKLRDNKIETLLS